jgi:hypothetical protein
VVLMIYTNDKYQMTATEIQVVRDMVLSERQTHCAECKEETEAQGIKFKDGCCNGCLHNDIKWY